ncbi:hypothetical protein NJ7G_4372 [Natrinema sp. J7-2]|nr:hypothetical protein NJ7G_4372 [Natrinema sp. J7-2]
MTIRPRSGVGVDVFDTLGLGIAAVPLVGVPVPFRPSSHAHGRIPVAFIVAGPFPRV